MLMVIFGAGASYDSCPTYPPGTPASAVGAAPGSGANELLYRLPLAKDLFANRSMFVEIIDAFPQCKTIVPRLRDPAVARGQASIETRLQEIAEEARTYTQASQELAAVRCYLQRAISQCELHWWQNTRGITNHLSLLREIQRLHKPTIDEPVCLVTFNYDTLLEGALAHPHIGLGIQQMDDYTRRPAHFRLFKLHGSVDWGLEVDIRFPDDVDPGNSHAALTYLVERAPAQAISNQFVRCDPNTMRPPNGRHALFPAIAIPVEKKNVFECPHYMIEELKRVLPHVTRILVIGWRATEDHFLALLKQHLKPGVYLSVVAAHAIEARNIQVQISRALPNNQPTATAETAEGFTEFMRSDRLQAVLTH